MPGLVLPAGQPLVFGPTAAGVPLGGGGFLVTGWAIEETTNAGRTRAVLRDGNSAAAAYMIPLTLAAGESRSDDAPGRAVQFESGLFLDVTAGTIAGTLFVVPTYAYLRDQSLVVVGLNRFGDLEALDASGFNVTGGDAARIVP